MARFNFKDNPVLNDETFIGSKKFRWDGTAWAREQFDLNTLLSQLKQESVTEAVTTASTMVLGIAPEQLDTFEELAAALNNDANFATTITNALATKADESTVTSSLATKADKTQTLATEAVSRDLVLADASKVLRCTNVSGITFTIPTDSILFPVGSEIAFVREGAGTVAIAPAATVTLQSVDNKRKIKGQFGTAALLKVAANTWVLAGSLEV
jgi:hypothetical protein